MPLAHIAIITLLVEKAAQRTGGTKRSLFRSDIDDETLNAYFQFISYFKKKFPESNIFYRFSGGDPMVLGARLFEIAARGYEIIGTKPYILTAGKALSEKWIEKAKQSAIKRFLLLYMLLTQRL